MEQLYNSTIAAISTAMSNSGIGIVRMSGPEAFQIADRVYKGKKEKKLCDQKSHTIHYGYIVDGEQVIDEVLVMLMRGPTQYKCRQEPCAGNHLRSCHSRGSGTRCRCPADSCPQNSERHPQPAQYVDWLLER